MKKRLTTLIGVASLVAATLAVTVAPQSASAAVGPGEDRQISTPTAWWTYVGQTAAQVSTSLSNNHARLTDIKLSYSGNSPRFAVTEVANSGAYASGWYWYYGLTPSQVATKAINLNARVTVLHCVRHASKDSCAAIMIKNTGANAESWTMWNGSLSFIKSKVNPSKNRMVSLSRVQGTSRYVAVFGSNTGTDATTWWWYVGMTATQIVNKALANHARVIDLDRDADTGKYSAIMYKSSTPWYMYVGQSATGLVNKASQLGQRLFDITPYSSGGHTYYAGVMVNNSNAATTAAVGALASKVPNGNWGFELKQVNGAVLAGVETTEAFEPASALKVLYHYKSILAEQAGTTSDSSGIAYYYDPAHPSDGDICPNDFTSNVGGTNLKNADTLMMQNSDNRMTRGVLSKYGVSAMLAEATHLGMTHTQIHHNIGCPTATTHNYTALSDLANLYSAYSIGGDFTTTWRQAFRDRMLNESNYPSAVATICQTVKQEAASLGKSVATANAFCSKITWIAKGGSYQYGGNNVTSPISWANGSLTSLPFKARGGLVLTSKSYFYGDFFDEVHFSTAAAKTALANARTTAFQEALRPQIRAALATW
jgi:hypothetical protein